MTTGTTTQLRETRLVPRERCSRSEGGVPKPALPVRGGPASALGKKIGDDGQDRIKTVRGVGYVLSKEPVPGA
jgi:hypothetical protein